MRPVTRAEFARSLAVLQAFYHPTYIFKDRSAHNGSELFSGVDLRVLKAAIEP
jgi:hypothetical protein